MEAEDILSRPQIKLGTRRRLGRQEEEEEIPFIAAGYMLLLSRCVFTRDAGETVNRELTFQYKDEVGKHLKPACAGAPGLFERVTAALVHKELKKEHDGF
ncbi:hypothetical protein B5X24_HaOG215159 [Helicoverpa armigera]|nr:hypothetical protein B5X24_HaOG215159 [Helicoverpa armigera]